MSRLDPDTIKIIAGLGNPSPKYENTYHNAGRRFVNSLVEGSPVPGQWQKYKNYFEYLKIHSADKVLVRTMTYMNNSGKAMKQAMTNFGNGPENLIVAHDDSDIPLGQFKVSFDRGSAGHKGVQSVIDHLQTKKFWRFRIGIRQSGDKRTSSNFVLKKIGKEKIEILEETFSQLENILEF